MAYPLYRMLLFVTKLPLQKYILPQIETLLIWIHLLVACQQTCFDNSQNLI